MAARYTLARLADDFLARLRLPEVTPSLPLAVAGGARRGINPWAPQQAMRLEEPGAGLQGTGHPGWRFPQFHWRGSKEQRSGGLDYHQLHSIDYCCWRGFA